MELDFKYNKRAPLICRSAQEILWEYLWGSCGRYRVEYRREFGTIGIAAQNQFVACGIDTLRTCLHLQLAWIVHEENWTSKSYAMIFFASAETPDKNQCLASYWHLLRGGAKNSLLGVPAATSYV